VNADEIRDLAALYALGGLDGEDLVRFESLLAAGDEAATEALRSFEATLVDLAAETAEAAPAGARAAVMSRVAGAARPAVAPIGPAPAASRR